MREPLAATRVPQADLDRADRLAVRFAQDNEVVALLGKPTRAAVLRLAIRRGLEVLEAQRLCKPRRKRAA